MIPFVFAALAVSTGVVLAALDSPHLGDNRRLKQVTTLLLAAAAAMTVAGITQALLF